MNPSLQEIDKLPVEVIQDFRRNRISKSIPEYLQRYILHLDKAAELFNLKGNVTEICKELMIAFPDDNLSYSTARMRVFDAINFFHLNNTVRNEAWDYYYADRLEALGRKAEMYFDKITTESNHPDGVKISKNKSKRKIGFAISSDENDDPNSSGVNIEVKSKDSKLGILYANLLREARHCFEKAHALRTKRDENAVDPDLLKPKDFLINPDISAERLGLKKQNLKQLWSDTATFIKKLDLEEEEKDRLLKESAEVIDVDYEDIKD